MSQPSISVALCTYNGAVYLQEQLDSIANQSRLPDELVVCDDVSSDGTVEILEAFARSAPFPVRIFRNPENLGYVRNFEQAIGLCKGDLIFLCDQDDVWRADKVQQMADAFAENPDVGLVFSDGELVDAERKPMRVRLWKSVNLSGAVQKRFEAEHPFAALVVRNYVTGATLAMRAAFREQVLPIPDHWVHDHWISTVISLHARLIGIPEPLIEYRQHEGNQIGASVAGKRGLYWGGMTRWLFNARGHAREKHLRRSRGGVEQMLVLNRYIASSSGPLREQRATSVIEGKLAHCRVRAGLSTSRFKRIPALFRELISGNYHRFSRGMYSFIEDLLI